MRQLHNVAIMINETFFYKLCHWCIWFLSLSWQNMLQRKFKKGKDCLGPRWEGASVKMGVLAVGMWEVVSVFKEQGVMKAGTQPCCPPSLPLFRVVTLGRIWGLGCFFIPQLNFSWSILTVYTGARLGDSYQTLTWKWRLTIKLVISHLTPC